MEAKDKILRIKALMEYYSINQSEFAKRIDSHQQTISDILNGKRTVGKSLEKQIINSLQLNKSWWETGEGDMFSSDGQCKLCAEKDKRIMSLELTIKTLKENIELLKENINLYKKINGNAGTLERADAV